ncbi:MAG: TetR/AcrR family transcriptional regulator [Muribaculaceae bacterium]|nr:TetR/AcrR family transcriptional regulator [Muribaculaceae bacterium]
MGKGESNKGGASRQKILLEAFRLFATMPYERVSFSVMEKEIGISRGSMVYYFGNKEGLFREVLTTLVYGTSSIKAVPEAYRLSLCSFYNYFIETLKREQEKIAQTGIININEALMRIENSALTYIDNFKELTVKWFMEEQEVWEIVIKNAISIGEIPSNINPELLARIFEDCYLGNAFQGVFSNHGYNIDFLKKEFDQIYTIVRN